VEAFGATDGVETMEEGTALARSLTNDQGADSCIVCVAVTSGQHIAQGVRSIRKAGTCVVTGLGSSADDVAIPISVRHLTLFQNRFQGSIFGASNPTRDIPLMLSLYQQGRLRLDELITHRNSLGQINEGYEDVRAGANIRGVIMHEH
jgi:Zn-dependent alcohol dehydrogenase